MEAGLKAQRLLVCGILLAACAHGSVREDAVSDADAPEDGVRTKGGSSVAFRVRALIWSGQYTEAEVLIAESIASGLLTRAAGEELRETVRNASDGPKDRGQDTQPRRPIPYSKTEEEETCSSRFPQLELCAALPEAYIYHSEQQALTAMKKELGQKGLSLHHKEVAVEGPCPGSGTHVNVRLNGKRQGSIVCCPCCVNSGAGPVEWEKCRLVW